MSKHVLKLSGTYRISAFNSDELTLTWRDLWRLVRGKTLRSGALFVSRVKGRR